MSENKRQSENVFNSKRHLEDSSRSRVNHIDNSQWIDNSFNNNNNNLNKRPKFDYHLKNSYVTNNLMPTQDMSDADDLNDGLDDLLSQMVDEALTPSIIGQSSAINNTIPTHLRHSPCNVGSDSDISMRTHQQSSNESSEASEGRLKILESRTNKLNEELLKARTQQIQTSNKIQAIKEDYKKQIIKQKEIMATKLQFATNQNNLQSSLIEQLQKTLKVYAPNAPIVQSVSEFLKNRNNCPNFSQIKCQEFFAPLSTGSAINSDPSPSHSSLSTIGEVLVTETQNSGLNDNRMVRLSGTFPSQIPTTQFYSSDISMPSAHQSMDTTSVQSIDETNNSEKSSLSQNTRMIWNSIRPVLEHKFNSDINLLNSQFFGQQIGLFDDKWLNTEELDDFTDSLNNLAIDMNLKVQPFIKN